MKSTFEVDKVGLSKILERRGKHFAVLELFQNSVDEDGVTRVDLSLVNWQEGVWELIVKDDSPEGFSDLRFAYTLFAESAKKKNPKQRGRFNIGEKLVVAICSEAEVKTTKGTVLFTEKGRAETEDHTEAGTIFRGVIAMSADEAKATEAAIKSVIVPAGITATFNGKAIPGREPLRTFEWVLRTEKADDEGYLRPTSRKATIAVYEPRKGETAALYELGIPVVETGDRWHVDVGQKVPLNTDRDNVQPSYLRDVRVAVLNHCADLLDEADAKWVDDALEDEKVEAAAVQAVIKGRFGDKAVIADPTDPEGTKLAVTKGYTVVSGGALSKAAWANVREAEALKPAGQVTPSPDPNVGADELDLMPEDHWPEGVRNIVSYATALAEKLLGTTITVRIVNDIKWPFAATYGPGVLTLNYGRLGFKWFDQGRTARVDALLLHEFAHHRVSDHLSHDFHDEVGRLGAKAIQLALDEPSLFEAFGPIQVVG